MSSIQIYYLVPEQLKRNMVRMGIDLDISVRKGDLNYENIKKEIKNDPYFCRDEESISYSHLLGLLSSNISLYAILDGKIAGLLSFMFLESDSDRLILFDGICSPTKYSGHGVGEELINTLIRIGKNNNIKYIELECRGGIMKYYRDKFGFEVINTKTSYDSDDSDEEDSVPYYFMRLDLSKVSGGKKRKNKSIKRNKKKKVLSTRKRRKLRKF